MPSLLMDESFFIQGVSGVFFIFIFLLLLLLMMLLLFFLCVCLCVCVFFFVFFCFVFCFSIFILILGEKILYANNVYPVLIRRRGLSLHCLPRSQKWDVRWGNRTFSMCDDVTALILLRHYPWINHALLLKLIFYEIVMSQFNRRQIRCAFMNGVIVHVLFLFDFCVFAMVHRLS